MKNIKNKKTLYAVVSVTLVLYVIASDVARDFLRVLYSRTFQTPVLTFVLAILTPIVVSILIFAKVLLQKNIPVQFSKIINISVTILFVVGVALFYNALVLFGLLHIIVTYPMATFIFCLQLCSLAYDLLPNRNKPD